MCKKASPLFRVTVLLLVMVLAFPVTANAVEPRASDYLSTYSAYIYPAGWGKVQVWVTVDSLNIMDEIGALEIQLYESRDNENWTWVETFQYPDYPDMLGYEDFIHSGHVEYRGTIGRYYQAYVCVWAGVDGDGDTRYFWTPPAKATLFAG